jgi:hypothetical protein
VRYLRLHGAYALAHVVPCSAEANFVYTLFAKTVPAQAVNVAVSDIAAQRFEYDGGVKFTRPAAHIGAFDLAVGPASAAGSGGYDRIAFTVADYELELETRPGNAQPHVLQYGTGYEQYPWPGKDANTYYYSRPRLIANGTITIAGERVPVHGTAWFDHQWGGQQGPKGQGLTRWIWFGLQLEDEPGTDVMLTRILGQHDEILLASGTISTADGARLELNQSDFDIAPTGYWLRPGNNECK